MTGARGGRETWFDGREPCPVIREMIDLKSKSTQCFLWLKQDVTTKKWWLLKAGDYILGGELYDHICIESNLARTHFLGIYNKRNLLL